MSERILIAEDENVLRVNLCEVLERAGFSAEGVPDGDAALRYVLEEEFLAVVADIRMPGLSGIELLKRVSAERPETHVLLMTAFGSMASAVEALRFGAFDYLVKPVVFEELVQKVERLVQNRALVGEVTRLRRDLSRRLGFEGIVGDSPAIRRVFDLVDKVAPTKSTVLVTGESGTGKELVARAIHAASAVRDREFLAVNVAALPTEVVEAQLFGHERGAFTGADRRREGLLRIVRGGTVFLDEVGDLPPSAQGKLLRAIDAREILPVGADRPLKAEFRLLAATNSSLETAVAEGRFRQDLLFRLDVFRIDIPPLRERREDIPALVSHFVRLHGRAIGKPHRDGREPGNDRKVTRDAMKTLLAYDWPGNVRELSNTIERAVILAQGDAIAPEHLPTEMRLRTSEQSLELAQATERFEREHIAWVLRTAGGNREQAARLLGIGPATLYRRLAKYGL